MLGFLWACRTCVKVRGITGEASVSSGGVARGGGGGGCRGKVEMTNGLLCN